MTSNGLTPLSVAQNTRRVIRFAALQVKLIQWFKHQIHPRSRPRPGQKCHKHNVSNHSEPVQRSQATIIVDYSISLDQPSINALQNL